MINGVAGGEATMVVKFAQSEVIYIFVTALYTYYELYKKNN